LAYTRAELEQRHARGTKRFLLDVDNCEGEPCHVEACLRMIAKTEVHCCRRTVSGWAIVFDACDTRELLKRCKDEWKLEVDLQRDSMLFVEQF